MCNGITLVERIDNLVKELGITRKEFAEKLDMNPSTIAAWKAKNNIPPIETLEIIARNLEVSVEWLVGIESVLQLNDFHRTVLSRKVIRKRIYETIARKNQTSDADNEVVHKCFFTNIPFLTYRLLYNWSEGRINLNEYVLTDIAYTLGVTLDYLLSGTNNNTENQFAATDQVILEKAKRNLNGLNSLDSLTGHRKQLATDLLLQFEELEASKHSENK